jgi:hypothetical protein
MEIQMALRAVPDLTPPDEARHRDGVFRDWLAGAETGWLECRVQNRHLLAGLSGPHTRLEVDQRQGVVLATETCPRCGTTVTQVIGLADGYLKAAYGRPRYEYEHPEYLLPHDATDNGFMSADQRAQVRHELVSRALQARPGSGAPPVRFTG